MKSVKRKRPITRKFKNKNKNKKRTIKLNRRKNISRKKKNNQQLTQKHKNTKRLIGGDTPMPQIIKHVNFFRDEDSTNYGDIEEYLNPIYGVIMCESGYIENNYYLAKERELRKLVAQPQQQQQQDQEEEKKESGESQVEEQEEEERDMSITPEMEAILKMSTVVSPNVKPNKDIMQHFSPYMYGRYIAILYVYTYVYSNLNLTKEKISKLYRSIIPKKSVQPKDTLHTLSYAIYKELTDELVTEMKEKNEKVNFSKLFGSYLHVVKKPLDKEENVKPSKEIFHILLYCLWWVSNNMEGVKEYYRGINFTFERINKTILKGDISLKLFPIVNITEEEQVEKVEKEEKKEEEEGVPLATSKKSFEYIVEEIVYKPFKVINYGRVNSFQNVDSGPIYPDCVETTMRNFINLILFDGSKFKLEILSENKVNENTIKYYETFPSFDSQMSNVKKDIYGKELDAKDAWSYLIIHHAKENIDFVNGTYEVNSGCMSKDNSKTNFIQLLQNLLSPAMINPENIKEKLPELNTLIYSVRDSNDAFKKGLGKIEINYVSSKKKYIVEFDFTKRHSESCVKIERSESKLKKNDDAYKDNQYILYLSDPVSNIRKINDENYLRFKYTSEALVNIYNKHINGNNFLELLTSELGNPDARSRVKIYAGDEMVLKDKLKYINHMVNDFIYVSDDFKFVDKIPHLTSLNHEFKNKYSIKKLPDLTPLERFTSIGNGFAKDCYMLSEIDLRTLTNLRSIGNGFASECSSLKTFELSKDLVSIGNHFADGCKLTKIDLNPFIKLESIGTHFAASCHMLDSIVLSNLPNLQKIGSNFAANCKNLLSITLTNLPVLKIIGSSDESNFAFNCENLLRITLTNLPELETIGSFFAFGCNKLTTVELSGLSKLHTIGTNFAFNSDVSSISLINLPELKTIGESFFGYCNSIKSVKLINVPKLPNRDFVPKSASLITE